MKNVGIFESGLKGQNSEVLPRFDLLTSPQNLFPHVDSGTSLRKINVLMERKKFGFQYKN